MKAVVGEHCFDSCQRKRAYLHRAVTTYILLTRRGAHRGMYLLLGNHQIYAGKQKQEWLRLWTHSDHLEQKPTALLSLRPITLICTMKDVPRTLFSLYYTGSWLVYIQPTVKYVPSEISSTPPSSEIVDPSGFPTRQPLPKNVYQSYIPQLGSCSFTNWASAFSCLFSWCIPASPPSPITASLRLVLSHFRPYPVFVLTNDIDPAWGQEVHMLSQCSPESLVLAELPVPFMQVSRNWPI